MASDEDLKLSDTVRYYMRDSLAAKHLLYRRARALANYEAANKALDKARSKNKDVQAVSFVCFCSSFVNFTYYSDKSLLKARGSFTYLITIYFQAENHQQTCCDKFDSISETAKGGKSEYCFHLSLV